MKKLSILTILLMTAFLFQSELIYAQSGDDVYSFMTEYLTDDEASQIDRAKSSISKGDKLTSSIRTEDKKIEKYQKKKKKLEKKSIDVKVLRIKQALYYDKGYSLVYNVYSEKIGECTFLYSDDEARANDLLEEAATDLSTAKRKMKPYRNTTAKDLKKKHSYSKIKSDLSSVVNTELSAINKLIEAYSIFLDQESKKQLEQEEKRVWDNALSENTSLAFQNYLDEYPNGKYASNARQKINELEAEEARLAREEQNNRSMAGALVFEVQIAASRREISSSRLARFYKAKDEIKMKHYDNWYKYSVGEFKTYEQAKAFVRQLKVRGAFVVAYKNDQKIDIKEAISGN